MGDVTRWYAPRRHLFLHQRLHRASKNSTNTRGIRARRLRIFLSSNNEVRAETLPPSEQQWYEMTMHQMWENWREVHKVRLLNEVKRQIRSEGDYAAYYYHPTTAKYARLYKARREEAFEDHQGSHA